MIKVKFVTPLGTYKEVETTLLNINTSDGQRGILPNHMSTVLMLNISMLETCENGIKEKYAIGGGMLYFENNIATILVNSIENEKDIDVARAKASKKRAEGYLASKDPNIDMKRAQIALKKAINRIAVASYK